MGPGPRRRERPPRRLRTGAAARRCAPIRRSVNAKRSLRSAALASTRPCPVSRSAAHGHRRRSSSVHELVGRARCTGLASRRRSARSACRVPRQRDGMRKATHTKHSHTPEARRRRPRSRAAHATWATTPPCGAPRRKFEEFGNASSSVDVAGASDVLTPSGATVGRLAQRGAGRRAPAPAGRHAARRQNGSTSGGATRSAASRTSAAPTATVPRALAWPKLVPPRAPFELDRRAEVDRLHVLGVGPSKPGSLKRSIAR
jgi:hypothetical protein